MRTWPLRQAIDRACDNGHRLRADYPNQPIKWSCRECGMSVYAYEDGSAFGRAVDTRCPGG